MNKSNTGLIIVAVILLVGIVGVVLWRSSGTNNPIVGYDSSDQPLESTGTEVTTADSAATATPPTQTTPKKTVAKPKPAPVYDTTLTSYRDSGYLIQFVDCQTTPLKALMNIKTGSKFAIQNVDSDPHVFTFGDKTYNLGSNAYAVLTAPAIGGWPITCDKINRAQVNSQR